MPPGASKSRKLFYRLDVLLTTALLVGIYFGMLVHYDHIRPEFDPDQWYHKAVSRIWYQNGFPFHLTQTLPQPEDLGWGKQFYEKEFLFHALTTVGYALGAERGVEWSAHLVALATFVLLLTLLVPRFGPWKSAIILTLGALFNTMLCWRFLIVRPHVLAMFFFTMLLVALQKRLRALAALATAGFALAYHAHYVPVIVLGLAFALNTKREKRWDETCLAALGGLFVGILVNPYFPTNVIMGQLHLRFATHHALPLGMEAGGELDSLSLGRFLSYFYPHCATLAVLVWLWIRGGRSKTDLSHPLALLSAAVFWIFTLKSQRASEYALPLTLFALATADFSALPALWRKHRILLTSIGLAILVGPLVSFAREAKQGPNTFYRDMTADVFHALELPQGQAKVLNASWGLGSYILYARPDLRFVDLLDPRFLEKSSPDRFELLARLKSGAIADARGLATDVFGAQYVLSGRRDLNAQLHDDPGFESIYVSERTPIALFRVKPEVSTEFVRSFETSDGKPLINVDGKMGSVYVPLSGPTNACETLRIPAAEVKRLAGARELGVGGGPKIAVTWNGRPLDEGKFLFTEPRLVRRKIALPRALKTGDRLDLTVCRTNAPFYGIAASLWQTVKPVTSH